MARTDSRSIDSLYPQVRGWFEIVDSTDALYDRRACMRLLMPIVATSEERKMQGIIQAETVPFLEVIRVP